MTRLTDDQLATARALEDWDTLVLAADPWIKFAMAELRCGDEDALQEGRLAACSAVRSWDPEKGAFSTHVTTHARFALLNYLNQNASGGVGSRHIAETGRSNQFISIDDPAEAGSSRTPADEVHDSHIDRLTYDDLDDSTDFERLMHSGELQNYADQVLRFIPEAEAEFFRALTRAGGTRAFSRLTGMPQSTISDRLRGIMQKLSVHSHKIDYIREATSSNFGAMAAQNGRWWIAEMCGNPWADWAYRPTADDVARGAAPRDDAYNWSGVARRRYPRIGVKRRVGR